jgi:hypothetical protein
MTLRTDLLNQIQSRLSSLTSTYISKADASDLFEAFIFTILLDAAEREGVVTPIPFEDTSGSVTSNIFFRRSPGYINEDANPYTHAVLNFPKNGETLELEAHIGIYAVGASGVPQECDIAVVLRQEGQRCRRVSDKKSVVKSTNILIGVECKCYQSSKVALGLGRSFLGLVQDLSSNGKYFFVFNGEKASVEKILAHYNKGWEHNISPTSAKEIERLRNVFQERFKNLKAKV